MIVIGSYALRLNGIEVRASIDEVDLIGSPDEVDRFRVMHASDIVSERSMHGHRHAFTMSRGFPFRTVEIDTERAPSDALLASLCPRSVDLLGTATGVPSVEALYLIKRAHANVAVHYDKTIRDLIRLKPLIGPIGPRLDEFYQVRRQECRDRYRLNRQRFSLSVRNEDFFALSDHVRTYVHDDLHEVVAFQPDAPLYKRCKRDLTLARIDVDLFERLDPPDRLRMVQEEFMVIGVERFYLHDRSLPKAEVYNRGMHKTIRDLFVGYFQDFCIDHADQLVDAPAHDFLARFDAAEAEGRLRKIEIPVPEVTAEHKRAWRALRQGRLDEARQISEDLVRRSEVGGDPHALYFLGAVLLRQRNLGAAERMLRHSLARFPENPQCLFSLGSLCGSTRRPAEARKLLESAERLGLRSDALYLNLGMACESLGARTEALAAFRAALARGYTGKFDVQGRITALELGNAAAS